MGKVGVFFEIARSGPKVLVITGYRYDPKAAAWYVSTKRNIGRVAEIEQSRRRRLSAKTNRSPAISPRSAEPKPASPRS